MIALLALTLTGCSDYGLHLRADNWGDAEPAIDVDPRLLDFRSADSGEERRLSFTIRNVGTGLLQVDDLVLEGSEAFRLVTEERAFNLDPEAAVEIEVAFTPREVGEQQGAVTVVSNDDTEPEARVDLLGVGNTPWLVITPEVHDFGQREIPCGDTVDLTLQNVGVSDLVIDGWSHQGGDGQFSVVEAPSLPVTLVTGAYTTITVEYLPGVAGASTGELVVTSNDPRTAVTASQSGEGLPTDTRTEDFTSEENPPVDILFAVDQSGSMDDDAERLAENFSTFIDTLRETTTGWRVGVVTYDHGCFNNGVIRNSTADGATLFAEAVTMGEDREISDDEALFSIVDRALLQIDWGYCNEGWRREGARMHVIVVSDEPERSEEHASAWTWDFFVDRFGASVEDPSLLKISGVLDTEDCNEGADNYREAVEATGGELLSICAGNWADYALALAEATVDLAWTFALSETPVPSSIAVSVDGAPLSGGFHYEAGLNAVVVDEMVAGQSVEITYSVAAECP
ncbi:MAG: choice-of-anchor D domain-containing protein [Alphaproteobacteria bacterium]|nr:choice-of-anchor D domain-containing protein [Alphaproteobacteria bacterium]